MQRMVPDTRREHIMIEFQEKDSRAAGMALVTAIMLLTCAIMPILIYPFG